MEEGSTVAVLQSPSTRTPNAPHILAKVPDILLMSTRGDDSSPSSFEPERG